MRILIFASVISTNIPFVRIVRVQRILPNFALGKRRMETSAVSVKKIKVIVKEVRR